MGLGLVGHQTNNGIEVGLGVGGRTHNGNGDGVGSLLDVLNGSGDLGRGNRLSGKRNHTVLHCRIGVGRCGSSRDFSRHSVTERLVTVHVHDATVLVANAQHHSQHLLQRVDVEVLSVQLDTVRGTREGTLGTRLPIRSGRGFSIPVGGNRSHLVEPVGRSSNGRTTHVVVGFVTLVVIEASLQNHLCLTVHRRNRVVEVDVRTRSPEIGSVIQSHIETLLIRAHKVLPIRISRMAMTTIHLVDNSIV